VRFQLFGFTEGEQGQTENLGTYGVIKGKPLFIVGTVINTDKAMEDYGYCMEKNILMATSLGLGTCWLGGFFKRSAFARRIGLTAHEVMPAVSPVGYATGKKTLTDSLFKFLARSKTRKLWQKLFYSNDFNTPLIKSDVKRYATCLEAVRLAPSASNQQPWRILKKKESNIFHFYLKRTKIYAKAIKRIDLQKVDMGIAMCHFELAARELGLTGSWQQQENQTNLEDKEYMISWME
jgi:nitroreductase